MHINVSHILAGEVGAQADFPLTGANPHITDLELVEAPNGAIRVANLGDKLRASGDVGLVLALECYRCLDRYNHVANLRLDGIFSRQPKEGEWPITARGEIDLVPLLREEALLAIPVQQICSPECSGLCADCGRSSDGHQHQTDPLQRKPRVTKKG